MISLDIGKHSKARVWVGELPILSPKLIEESVTMEVKRTTITRQKLAAIELLIPQGGKTGFGLLGAEFTPDRASTQLLLKLNVVESNSSLIDWSLASSVDNVRSGLPNEFVDSVIQGVQETKDVIGSGILHFKCAAVGEVGSSPHIFWQMARIIVNLLHLPEDSTFERVRKAVIAVIDG